MTDKFLVAFNSIPQIICPVSHVPVSPTRVEGGAPVVNLNGRKDRDASGNCAQHLIYDVCALVHIFVDNFFCQCS